MRVFVISDTHDRLDTVERFLGVLRASPEPAHLIHLGDVVSPFTLRLIAGALPGGLSLRVVLGNNDADKLLLSKVVDSIEDQPMELEVCGLRAILLHGFKSPELTERIARGLACSGYYDIVMYGHTHRFRLDKACSGYLLNPGALSGYLAEGATYAVVDCNTRTASVIDLKTGLEILSLPIETKA